MREIRLGENKRFCKIVISDHILAEQVAAAQNFAQLLKPICDERELDRKTVTFGVIVEPFQERIFRKPFENELTARPFGHQFAERGFSSTYISFYRDVCVWAHILTSGF